MQLDHVVPRARGGGSTVENLRCLCEAHNLAAARVAFGDGWMQRFAPRARAEGEGGGVGAAPPPHS